MPDARTFLSLLAALTALPAAPALAGVPPNVCGDGAITGAETCDDGNIAAGDGCDASCEVEDGWFCVPSLHASGVSPAGVALAQGLQDPHWVWSLSPDGSNPTRGVVTRYPAWGVLPPGNWVSTDANFGIGLTSQPDTYWFQSVFMPASFAGNLTFPVAVAADNEAEVFVNGTSYGTVVGFGSATQIQVPSSAFVPGNNVISIRLREYIPGTPRGILMYPGGGGILSQCTVGCTEDGECDDGNACTTDTCIEGACQNASQPFGTTCTSTGTTTGVCTEALPIALCVGCVNTSTSTTRTSTVPQIDLGCDGDQPFCDDTGLVAACVECELDADCDEGDFCLSGVCTTPEPEDAGVALDSGAGEDASEPTDAALADIGTDAGAPAPIDAGGTTPPDAGAPSSDAGGARDAAATADAGGAAPIDEGCDCEAAGGPAPLSQLWWALSLAALGVWTRARRSRRG